MEKQISELSALGINIPRKFFNSYYKIYEILGEGGFGTVYKVKNIDTMKTYAAKATDISEIFEIYFHLIIQCNHPNLIRLHDYFIDKGTDRGNLYLIYDYVPDAYRLHKLQDTAHRSPWYINYLIKVLRDVSSALEYIHKNGILHLDIKPDNILASCSSNIASLVNRINDDQITGYLIDYGLSCLKDSKSDKYDSYLCINRKIIRDEYIFYSPELLNTLIPMNMINEASDIYSLGVTIQLCMLNKSILPEIYFTRNIFHCRADQLNSEYKVFKDKHGIINTIQNVLLDNKHVHAHELFDLSVKMVDYDPIKRPTINEIIDTLKSFQ